MTLDQYDAAEQLAATLGTSEEDERVRRARVVKAASGQTRFLESRWRHADLTFTWQDDTDRPGVWYGGRGELDSVDPHNVERLQVILRRVGYPERFTPAEYVLALMALCRYVPIVQHRDQDACFSFATVDARFDVNAAIPRPEPASEAAA
jgi:hypothetical protein